MNNYLQAGVGVDYVKKYVNKLLNNNYTIVIVDQVTQKPNVERKVTRILSPGTYIENYNSDDSNYLMSIYIEDFGTITLSHITSATVISTFSQVLNLFSSDQILFMSFVKYLSIIILITESFIWGENEHYNSLIIYIKFAIYLNRIIKDLIFNFI